MNVGIDIDANVRVMLTGHPDVRRAGRSSSVVGSQLFSWGLTTPTTSTTPTSRQLRVFVVSQFGLYTNTRDIAIVR